MLKKISIVSVIIFYLMVGVSFAGIYDIETTDEEYYELLPDQIKAEYSFEAWKAMQPSDEKESDTFQQTEEKN